MALQSTPHTIPLLLAALVAAIGAAVAWRRRRGMLEIWGTITQIGITFWALNVLATVSVTGETAKFVGVVLSPAIAAWTAFSFLLFTVYFVGRDNWVTRPRLLALFAYPFVLFVAGATNGIHGQMYLVEGVTSAGFETLEYSYGWLFYALFLPGYLANLTFIALLFQQFRRSRNVYRTMNFILFVCLLVLTLVTFPSLFGASPFPHLMLFPYAYLVLGIFLLLGTSSATFLRRVPVDRMLATLNPTYSGAVPTARDVVVQEIDDGILVLDADMRVVDINERAKEMIGADRPVGKPLSAVIDTDVILTDSVTGEALESGEMFAFSDEIWVETPSGNRCYDVRVSELAVDDERVAGHVALLHDITAQKRREEQLRDRETELERQKENLQTQKTQLEHQNEQLDKFAGIVSHDLRNPLNVARGRINLTVEELESADDPAVEPDHARMAGDALERMEAIIDDALELARQGKAITETDHVALDGTVRRAWSNVDTRDATLENCEPVLVESDPGRLLNVFENLFRNAIEHGRDDVTISVGVLPDGFYVEDDGPGIPDDRKDDVFEEGYTTADSGTGFGLAIARDIVRAHGWDIRATDASDGGARFEVTGVNFTVTRDQLVDELGENLDDETAERLVESVLAEVEGEGDEFTNEKATTILERMPEVEDGNPAVRDAVDTVIEEIQ